MKVSASERRLVAALTRALPLGAMWRRGAGDYCLSSRPARSRCGSSSNDCVVEGVHFEKKETRAVGWKRSPRG